MGNEPLVKEEEKEHKRPMLEVIQGGKTEPKLATSSSEPPTSIWLHSVKEGDKFLIKDILQPDYVLQEFELVTKEYDAVDTNRLIGALLFTELNTKYFAWVDPIRFCARYMKVKIIGHRDE